MRSKGYLIDTHIFIWLMEKNPRLQKDIYTLLKNPHLPVSLSLVSIWEIVIKRSRKSLRVPKNFMRGAQVANLLILPIGMRHVLGVEKLVLYHKDPFDRMLISQAKEEKLTLITHDKKIWKYDISILKV